MADFFFYYLCCLCSLVFPLLFTLRINNSWKSRISIIIVVSAHKGLWNEYKKCGSLLGFCPLFLWAVRCRWRTKDGTGRRKAIRTEPHRSPLPSWAFVSDFICCQNCGLKGTLPRGSRIWCGTAGSYLRGLQNNTGAQAPDPTGPPTWKTKQPCPHTLTHRSSATFMMIDNTDNTNDAQSIYRS